MKSSTLLREARKFIDSYQCRHLCFAIFHAGEDEGTLKARRKALTLTNRIMNSIAPYSLADMWLHEEVKAREDYEEWRIDNSLALREWRIRWLDALIKEYEAKGD